MDKYKLIRQMVVNLIGTPFGPASVYHTPIPPRHTPQHIAQRIIGKVPVSQETLVKIVMSKVVTILDVMHFKLRSHRKQQRHVYYTCILYLDEQTI